MSKTANQLDEVFQEVSDYFASVSGVTVVPGEGTPPEQYTVTYNLNGVCKESDGEVYNCDSHVISISLPFGFPHFPPNCLPKSPVFHPDFDSSAICIGDVWEENKSVVQLILHIGRMIAGEVFSTSNVFNDAAAEWYQANSDQLPFDTADFQSLPEAPPPQLEEPDVDVDRLQLMAKQKRFTALSRELTKIKESFPERQALETETANAIDICSNHYREAEELEHQGKQKEALEKFAVIESLVSDYPLIQEAKSRVQQAFELLGGWVDGDGADESAAEDTFVESGTKGQRTFFEEKKESSKKWIAAAVGIGAAALLGTLVFIYFSFSSSLEKAENCFTECRSQLDKNNFTVAEQKCNEALTFISEVQIVKQSETDVLAGKIKALLMSPKLQQGLKGKVMFQGAYVSTAVRELILAFEEAKQHGDSFFEKERWDEAALSYAKALKISRESDAVANSLLAAVRKRMPRAQFNGMMLAGEKALAGSDWNDAAKSFGAALKLAKDNPNVLPEDITRLELLSQQAAFNMLRDEGHIALKNRDWAAALRNYQHALELAETGSFAQSGDSIGLRENIVRTRIYMAVEKGKKAFANAQWDEVVSQYEKAIVLLEDNSELLSSINIQKSGEKLSRIMLHVEIIKGRQELARYLKADEFEQAVSKMREIQKSILSSTFAALPEFKGLVDELTADISEIKNKIRIRKQSSYLVDNFEMLFLKHYPAASGSVLSTPKVEFQKTIDGKLLFRMQCTEKAGGRPLRLQMDYLYSPVSGDWQFYTGK